MFHKRKIKKKQIVILTILLCVVITNTSIGAYLGIENYVVEAHSGRTDKKGGHRDNKNKSGLGFYHYHCGGYPAHLHVDGVCPYSGGVPVSSSSANVSSNSNVNAVSAPIPIVVVAKILSTMLVGESQILDVRFENCDSSEYTIESSNENIVCVNSDKTISAVSPGTAKITIKNSKASKTMNITVKEVPVTSVTIENIKERIQLDTEMTFNVEILPENATYKEYTIKSSNEDIVTVIGSNNIKACGTGTVEIVCEAKNGVKSNYEIVVYEVFPEKIQTNFEDLVLEVGKEEYLEIKIFPENANNKSVTVFVENENILCVEESRVIANTDGKTNIIISTSNGIVKKIPVEVFHEPVTDIEIDTEELDTFLSKYYMDCDETLWINANVLPENATYQNIEWQSSDEKIVKIADNQFEILGTGNVTLTAIASDNVQREIEISIVDKDKIENVSFASLTGAIVTGVGIYKRKKYINK